MRTAPERKQALKPTNKTSQPELAIVFSHQSSLPPNEFSVASRVIPGRKGKRVTAYPRHEIMILRDNSPSQVAPDWKQTQQREMGCDELANPQPYDTGSG